MRKWHPKKMDTSKEEQGDRATHTEPHIPARKEEQGNKQTKGDTKPHTCETKIFAVLTWSVTLSDHVVAFLETPQQQLCCTADGRR